MLGMFPSDECPAWVMHGCVLVVTPARRRPVCRGELGACAVFPALTIGHAIAGKTRTGTAAQAAGSVARSGAEQLHEPARADLAIRRAETTRVTTRDLIRAAESLSSRRGKRAASGLPRSGRRPPVPPSVVGCAAWTRRNVCQNTPGLIDYLDTMYVNDT